MNENEKKKKTKTQAEQLMELLQEEIIDPATRRMLQGWFWSEAGEEAKDRAMEIYFSTLHPDPDPDARVDKIYRRVARRLGFGKKARKSTHRVHDIPVSVAGKPSGRTCARRPLLRPALVAAVALPLLMLGAGTLWLLKRENPAASPSGAVASVDITAADQPQTVLLPDGSTVRLTPGSRITYAEDFPRDRSLTLDGDGYFRVARDEQAPFTVCGGGLRVTVLGTEFRMRTGTGESAADVQLAAGSVEVTAGEHRRVLTPGEALTYDRREGSVRVSELARGELLRLRCEKMKFDDEPLGEILRTVAGYYGVSIEVEEEVDTRRTVIVGFDGSETLDDVLFILQSITADGFRYTIQDRKVNITP